MFRDPDVAIDWPMESELMPFGARDAAAPRLRELEDELPFVFESVG